MNDFVKCCAILHNMIVESCDAEGSMGAKEIVFIDPHAEIILLTLHAKPSNRYAETVHL